ncbi:hypothetical protein SAMN05421856_101497 [Chryseobacterium taichungense]|uniref:Uncharacterized protein n=1 Tax=Chryseobacterium taichungense TaxID=295069 RepID=A0A1H7W545_9FLAO|nr:hypothetical protein SAMN05421856_101497 [Chryseobacterium taichungense]
MNYYKRNKITLKAIFFDCYYLYFCCMKKMSICGDKQRLRISEEFIEDENYDALHICYFLDIPNFNI